MVFGGLGDTHYIPPYFPRFALVLPDRIAYKANLAGSMKAIAFAKEILA